MNLGMNEKPLTLKELFTGSSVKDFLGLGVGEKKSLKKRDLRELYEQPELLPQVLDFRRYVSSHQCFVSSDEVSHGIVIEITNLHTQGKTEQFAIDQRDQVASAYRQFPQYTHNPYVLQTFSSDEGIEDFIEGMKAYQARFGVDDSYRKDYLELWEEHLKNLSREGGYFVNKSNGSRWGGISRKTRCVIYRDLSSYNKDMFSSPLEEIKSIADQFIQTLTNLNVQCKIYDPSDVYNWLVPWFNPRPEGYKNGREFMLENPLRYTKGEDFLGLDEYIFKSYPYFDVENRCVRFNETVHSSIVSVDRFAKNPPIAVWNTAKGDNGTKNGSPLQRLPEGSIVATTTVFIPDFHTEGMLNQVSDHSKGQDERSLKVKSEVSKTKLALDTSNSLFPSSVYVYVKGDSLDDMKKNRQRTLQVLRENHFDPIETAGDLAPIDSYIKYLPFSYKPSYDKHLYRTRLAWDKHLASALPIFGSSTGSGNHCLTFLTPEGEPFSFDPLNGEDKEQNSFMGVLAPPGSGKSAFLNQFICSMKATHNPYFFVIDVNGSFKLQHAYFKEHGLSAEYLEVSPEGGMNLPLFGDAIQAYKNMKAEMVGEESLGFSENENVDISEDPKVDPEDERRDPLGEMILTAKLMITKGMPEAEKLFQPNDYSMLANAIFMAAEKCISDGHETVIPKDVIDALWKIAETGVMYGHDRLYREDRRYRAEDMAEAMLDYTQGVKGKMFNKRGSSEIWPDCDFLVLDLKMLAKEGYEDILYLTFIGLMNRINSLLPERRGKGRETIVINDEAHIINMVRTLALFKRKSVKMWRKEGGWLVDATQNIKDYPDEALDILNVMEWLILLKMPKSEIEALEKFREISEEEKAMLHSLEAEKGKYVEGMVLSNKIRCKFRSVPPAFIFALGQTEQTEYAERLSIMNEHDVTEIEAAHILAKRTEERRCEIR